MADPDARARLNLARNRNRRKCPSCRGSGYVMKYVRPNVVDMVECLSCRGTGQEDASAWKHYRQQFGVRTNQQIDRAERKRLKRGAKAKP